MYDDAKTSAAEEVVSSPSSTQTEKYVPSPVDPGAFTGQIIALVCIALAVGYVQAVLNPTARARFNASDDDKKKYVKELMAGENEDGDTRQLERWYYRKVLLSSGLRPRGDQTKGGTVVPGMMEEKKGKRRERVDGGDEE